MFRFLSATAFAAVLASGALAQGWLCYGGNAQHSGVYTGTSQTASLIKWQAPLDDDPAYYGGEVLAHFAAPMVTPTNTVVYGYRFTTTVNSQPDYDNWKVLGRTGATGKSLWTMNTDYSAAVIWSNDWTSVFPITLFQSSSTSARGVAAGGAGGSILVRNNADTAAGTVTRMVFYTSLANYTKNAAAFAPIKINTPLSADTTGNIYFGYEVTGSVPSSVASLGTGGIAKVNARTGATTFASVQSLKFDTSLSRSAMNAAPAVSADGNYIYVALTGGNPYLVKLKTKDLSLVAHAQMFDPSIQGANVSLIDESSASPMIGPDGHVFMGVFGNQWRESHGWMLQFDGDLSQVDTNGKTYPVGSFGWDDTAVVVQSNLVSSYKGSAKYLILTKYNNYDDNDGDPGANGQNHVAILDPTSNSTSTDRQSGIPVMNEVLLVLGITKSHNDGNFPNAVNEWCINSAAVDVNRKSAIINSEDGHMYRWDFTTNSLTESLLLAPPTGEAYTMTAIGPDGQIYIINDTILFAIGSNNATSISNVQGTSPKGTVKDIWSTDGEFYTTKAVSTAAGQTATVEAHFTLTTANPTSLTISATATAVTGANGIVYAYNNSKKSWDMIGDGPLSASNSIVYASTSATVKQYVGSGGLVKVRFQALLPTEVKTPFVFAVDQITCGLN
jgi:hypothetical protein